MCGKGYEEGLQLSLKHIQEVRACTASGASACGRLRTKWASGCFPAFLFRVACFTWYVRTFKVLDTHLSDRCCTVSAFV